MIPKKFKEANTVLRCPKEVKDCTDLHVHIQPIKGFVVSCWQPTAEELEEINRTGKIWLHVQGTTHPPLNITGKREDLFLPE